jgi:6-phosphogluconolactonase
MDMDARVFPDLDALSRGILDELLRVVREAISQRGRFAIALSGGKTPAELYKLWAAAPGGTDWKKVHLFWGDERYVAESDELSNFRMTRETGLLDVVPAENVHPMRGPEYFPSPEAAAEAYEAELRSFFGAAAPAFDVQLLGLGVEGHVASLFPDSSALAERRRWVVPVQAPAKPPQRLTLTPVVLNRGRHTFFLVAGANKHEIVAALRAEPDGKPSQYPAGQIRPEGRSVWFLDRLAEGR